MTLRLFSLGPNDDALRTPSIADIPALLADPATILWIDMDQPGEPEKRLLLDTFKLHPVVVDDMIADATTPKVERFEDYIYVVFHGLQAGCEKTGDIAFWDLDMFLGQNFLITSHDPGSLAATHALDTVRKKPTLLRKGPAYVAYLLVENLTERFLPLIERIDHEVDELETMVVKSPGPQILERVFELRHKLQKLRRVGMHQRELLNRLGRGDFELVPEDTRPFFRDAYDHFVRIVDMNDSFREIVSSAMEAYLSVQSHKLNEIMKVLTLISTIMLPLTFIAGVYGMNFENMPELHMRWGYYVAWAAMITTAITFFVFFRRRGWI